MELNKIYNENCMETMKRMPDNFVNCVVTSPPYWGLRDYGHEDQIGLEKTPEEYVNKMVEIFREVRRVLKKDGTLWLNLGDTYNNNSSNQQFKSGFRGGDAGMDRYNKQIKSLKPKDLIGIPWRVALALQADGWWLRSDVIEEVELYCPCGCGYVLEERIWRYSQDRDIIWHKPNPVPESVKDRCTKAHEYIFLMSKSAKYYYDWKTISEVAETYKTDKRPPGILRQRLYENSKYLNNNYGNNQLKNSQYNGQKNHTMHKRRAEGLADQQEIKRNRHSVWKIATQPYPEAHFAVFPEKIPSLCILAGCPKDGIVYDPFMGAGTTALAALKYRRQFIGSEINSEYCEIAEKRLKPYLHQMSLFQEEI